MHVPKQNSMGPGRRRFLKQAALAGAALAAPALWLPGPARARRRAAPVRVRGRVEAGGRGLEGVGVTDGLTVARTEADGAFELIADARQPFVHCSVPAGHRIPQNETGTARFYEPLRPNGSEAGEQHVRFALEPMEASDEHHAFIAMADPQTQTEEEMRRFHEQIVPDVRQAARALGEERPAFGVACGDIMFDDLSLYPAYERAVAEMGLPFFQVLGNHDMDFDGMTDGASAETFRSHFGPAYYSFDRGAAHYVVLDDVFWNGDRYFGYLTGDQLHWLRQDLARVEAGRPVVVFAHIPMLSTRFRREGEGGPSPGGSVANREALYRLLEPYEAHVVTGHTHEMEHVFEGGAHEHVLGTACGAWWSGPICYDGTPKGYAVFDVRGEEIRWRYKSAGRDSEHQLRVYERGADPAAPDEIVANVWDWDSEWRVVWYEGGERKGAMARRVGTDPLSEKLHAGAEDPERRPWVDPVPTGHLFYAPAGEGAGEIRVEATDRFGRTYTATPAPVAEAAAAGASR